MLQRRISWMFAVLIVVLVTMGLFSMQATVGTSRDFNYLIDHTAPTLHALNHLKAATARLMLEAERLASPGPVAPVGAFERAQSSFEEALAEYEIVALLDEDGAGLGQHISRTGDALLAQSVAWLESDAERRPSQLAATLTAFQDSERQLSTYLEEAITLESGELEQGDALADRAANDRKMLAIFGTAGALILAATFGTLLIRQAGSERQVKARLQASKGKLEEEVAARTESLRLANRALQAQLQRRERVEVALAQSEERFRVAAEEALVGIYIIQDEKLRYVNPAMAHFLGYEPHELIDTVSPLELVVAEDRQGVARRTQQRLAGIPAQAPHCFKGLRRDGRELILESIGRRVQYQGRPAVIGTIVDVTDRQRATLEITRRNRQLQALLAINQHLAGEFSLKERLQAITDAIVKTVAAAGTASLWLYDETSHHLSRYAHSGYDAGGAVGLAVPGNELLARLVSAAGRPLLVTRPVSAADDHHHGLDEGPERAVLGAAILLEGHLLGALFANASVPDPTFDRHDLSFIQSVAGEAAIAIKNAQLLKTGERQLKELQQLSQKLLLSREAEARRISQELHDVMGQSLTAISINLAEIKRELGQAMSARDRQRLEESEMLTRQTLQEMRELSLDLRPSMLDELGLVPTLRWYVHRFGQRLGIPASLEVKGVNGRMAPEIETALYRVVQEGLTNVARHARAQTVCVRVSDDGARLVLAIEDDGLGFDNTEGLGAGDGEHMGLIGMRERVALLGGTMQVDSAPGHGTVLLVCLPDPCTDHTGQRQMDRMTEPL